MNKTKKIEIRVTEDEYDKIQKEAEANNMTKSEYIRNRINAEWGNYNSKEIAHHVCNMQSYVNKIIHLSDLEDELIKPLQKELNKIWLYL